jgi:hypothetical protein
LLGTSCASLHSTSAPRSPSGLRGAFTAAGAGRLMSSFLQANPVWVGKTEQGEF